LSYKKFSYKSKEELRVDLDELSIPFSENLEILEERVKVGEFVIPNRLVAFPMEGGDALPDGSPSELTMNKYERYARNRVGVIWIEAVSVCQEGKSNPKQLMITKDNFGKFQELSDRILRAGEEVGHRPIVLVQLNHSGRYSNPYGQRKPIISSHKHMLDERLSIDNTYPVVLDEYIEGVENAFVNCAVLCKEAGFDGVDVKACHGYFGGELLSGYERQGKYGGSLENRTKYIFNIVEKIKAVIDVNKFLLASRIGVYDGVEYPFGFGVDKDNKDIVDLEEPIKLVKKLVESGVKLIGITMGNPYFVPHITRPYDLGIYYPNENPIDGVNRFVKATTKIQKSVPEAIIMAAGYSWFRHYAPYVMAGMIENGNTTLIGFGRMAIAYPEFAEDIFENNEMSKSRTCIACSKCSELKANTFTCGCVVREPNVYMSMYKSMVAK